MSKRTAKDLGKLATSGDAEPEPAARRAPPRPPAQPTIDILPADEPLELVDARGEARRSTAPAANGDGRPRLTPDERAARKAARMVRAAGQYRPALNMAGSFDRTYGRAAMAQTERMNEQGGQDRHGAFVDAAVKAGILKVNP